MKTVYVYDRHELALKALLHNRKMVEWVRQYIAKLRAAGSFRRADMMEGGQVVERVYHFKRR